MGTHFQYSKFYLIYLFSWDYNTGYFTIKIYTIVEYIVGYIHVVF
jgi:hypothetical protein